MDTQKKLDTEVKPVQKLSRTDRRIQERKQKYLDELILTFFTERSKLRDPEGEEAEKLFIVYRNKWLVECTNHNKTRTGIKLRYEAFTESVEHFLNEEKKQKSATELANKAKNFPHWFRRKHVWKTMTFTAICYLVRALFRKDKFMGYWKNYYLTKVMI